MLRKSLDLLADSKLRDSIDGGFFRYSSTADWSEPQLEKMLDDNVQLARAYLDASIVLEQPRYRVIAEETFDFILAQLYDAEAGGFRGSIGAHSEYFALDAVARSQASPPPRDASCYAGPGAITAAALLDASWKLGRRYRRVDGVDTLTERPRQPESARYPALTG